MKALAVALLAAATAEPTPRLKNACAVAEVALADLARQGGDPVLFSLGFPHRSQFADADHGLVGVPSGREASAALAQWDADRLTSAMACPNVRHRAASLGEVLTDDAGQAKLQAMGLNGKIALFWRLSMPVLATSGREAVVAAYASSNQLAGGAQLLHLARQRDGSWIVTGRRILSMS